nr:TPA_inf: conotoxin precursor T [Conus judaeus]
MLCLPVFIILLLLASSAAPNPLEKRIQSDFIRAALEELNPETQERFSFSKLVDIAKNVASAANQILNPA